MKPPIQDHASNPSDSRPDDPAVPTPSRDPGSYPDAATLSVAAAQVRSTAPPSFQAGDVLAGRYRIERFLARGGMGEVYAAVDQDLGGFVALKLLRADIAMDRAALDRFKREIQLARRVTHPNVCRIFDIEYHQPPAPPGSMEAAPAIPFLTMELLQGETLSARLRRIGSFRETDAMPLVRQIAAALQAAHDVGVIHRDFKSGNVVLVPPGSGSSHDGKPVERAVVTDFGLAYAVAAAGEGQSDSLTEPGAMLGTPAYMAPEQVRGEETTAATDIYAFGIVLFEMLTGKRPFEGAASISVLLKRLLNPPPSPRLHAPELNPRWEEVILRCLEPRAEDRFASVADSIRALEGQIRARRPGSSGKGWRVAALVAAAALVLGAGGLLVANFQLRLREPTAPASTQLGSAHARRSAAVMGFANLSGRPEQAWLSAAFAELLGTELAAGERLRVFSGEDVARVKSELSLPEADSLSRDELHRMRKNLGTDLVLLGSYIALGERSGGKLRLDVRIQDVESGETIARFAESGTEADLLELVSRVGARLRESLDVAGLSPGQTRDLVGSRPANPEAARLYAAGRAKLLVYEAPAARDLLQEAVAADPEFPLAHSALAAAWSALGHTTKSREAITKAFELSGRLSREERLSVEGLYREALQQREQAIQIYQTLSGLFPDDLEYGLRLAAAQSAAGRGKDALLTVEELRRLPPPAGTDPRIDLAEAEAASTLSDFRHQLEAATRAAAEGQAREAWLLVGRARLSEWWAYRNLGELAQAEKAAAEAKRISASAGDRGGVALALNALATVLSDQGKLDASDAADTEALSIFRQLGDKRRIAWELNNLARNRRSRGDLPGAQELYEEALAICREIDDRSGTGRALANLGRVLFEQGQLKAAKPMYEESLAIRKEIGERRGVAGAMLDLATVLMRQGELETAMQGCAEAAGMFREVGDKQSAAHALSFLGEARRDLGDLDGARRAHEEALAVRTELRLPVDKAASRMALAEISLESGRAGEAEAQLRELLREPQRRELGRNEGAALSLLARCLLAENKVGDALAASDEAMGLAQRSAGLTDRLWIRITGSRVRAAALDAEQVDTALKDLESTRAEAAGAGLTGLELQARLAAIEIGLAAKNPASLAQLRELRIEAETKKFGLIVRKCEALDSTAH